VIRRYEGNPILTHRDVPYPTALAYNGSVIRWEERYVMLFRNDCGSFEEKKLDGQTDIGPAFSDDGFRGGRAGTGVESAGRGMALPLRPKASGCGWATRRYGGDGDPPRNVWVHRHDGRLLHLLEGLHGGRLTLGLGGLRSA